jgi:hypothetical protein
MKVLFIYCNEFAYTPTTKTIADAKEDVASAKYENVQVAFIQSEREDMERENDVITKLLKNLKWVSGKNQVKKVILHSFAHLSDSKADPDFTMLLFNKVEERMKNAGFEVSQTPFGYFLDLQVDAPGFSLARVFKDI